MGVGPFSLELAFSVKQGRLVSESTKEVYTLATMLLVVRTALGKSPFDVEGATSAIRKTAGQAKQEVSDQRARAHGATVGLLPLAAKKPRRAASVAARCKPKPTGLCGGVDGSFGERKLARRV